MRQSPPANHYDQGKGAEYERHDPRLAAPHVCRDGARHEGDEPRVANRYARTVVVVGHRRGSPVPSTVVCGKNEYHENQYDTCAVTGLSCSFVRGPDTARPS